MHIARLRTVGGSVMVAIPRPLLESLGLAPNMKVGLSVEGGRLLLEPSARLHYALDELLAQCDVTAPLSAEDQEWLESKPVGNEII